MFYVICLARTVQLTAYRTHTWLLGPLINKLHVNAQLCIKTLRFILSMINSPNNFVSYVSHLAMKCAASPVGNNISFLRYKYSVHYCDELYVNINRIKKCQVLSQTRQVTVDLVVGG